MSRPEPPAVNRERGEVPLLLRDRWIILRMDYDAVVKLNEVLGDDFNRRLGEATRSYDVEVISRSVTILAQRHQPGMTVEAVREASPAYYEAINAVGACLNAFMWGAAEPPVRQKDADGGEETRPLRGWRRFARRTSTPSGRESRRPNSGA